MKQPLDNTRSAVDWAIPRQATPLGHPLPLDEHACSVSLPTWQSVVGYEEGWKSITSQLKCGYPRFVYHPYVIQLMDQALEIDQALQQLAQLGKSSTSVQSDNSLEKPWDCIVLPSRDSAIRCHDFLIKACGFCTGFASSPRFAKNYHQVQGSSSSMFIQTNTIDLFCPDNALDWVNDTDPPLQQQVNASSSFVQDPWYNPHVPIRMLNLQAAGTYAIIFPAQTAFALEAKSYWQHSGEIVSSRRAECALIELYTTNNYKHHRCLSDDQKNENTLYKEQVPSSFSINRFTSCYYHKDNAENPQSGSCSMASNIDDSWKTCSKNPNIKYMAHHPSMVMIPSICEKEQGKNKSNPFQNKTSSSYYYDLIRNHIADITFTSPSCVFLTSSGMASIYTALRSARRRNFFMNRQRYDLFDESNNLDFESNHSNSKRQNMTSNNNNGGTAIVFGFPYLDTLKMCTRSEWVPGGVEFFGFADDQDLDQLSQWLNQRRRSRTAGGGGGGNNTAEGTGDAGVSILLTEYPSNPLLKCPDLKALRTLADEYDFALVVDDTIGNFANLDLLSSGLADAVCTSLTKLFSGRGDVIAGSVVTNPNTAMGRWMQQDLMRIENRIKRQNKEMVTNMLFMGDAAALEANARDFLERSNKINQTAEAFADWLKERDEVAKIYYPKYSCGDKYLDVLNMRPLPMLVTDGRDSSEQKPQLCFHKAGYGGLMSIILQSNICQRTFYDNLNISKGPSLGTNFTLLCPYTLLAHYHELDFAMSYNVEPNLLRISVGLEDLDELKEKFSFAFQSSRLYPTVPPIRKNVGSNESRRLYTTWSNNSRLGKDFMTTPHPLYNWTRRPITTNVTKWNGLSQHTCLGKISVSKSMLRRSLIHALRLLH